MDTPSEDTTDDELADLMADPDLDVPASVDGSEHSAGVEVGIPPSLEGDDGEITSTDESFSVDDFEEDFHSKSAPEERANNRDTLSSEQDTTAHAQDVEENLNSNIDPNSTNEVNGHDEGDVAKFRKTLSSLSRQLELDRLTFLHKAMIEQGENVPTLTQIASDITGEKLIKAQGDCDLYGKRPSTRFEGWVSGLSFGVSKRAKKFSK